MPVPHAPPTAPIPSMAPVVPESSPSGMGSVPRKVSQPIAPGMGDNTSLSSYGAPSGGIPQSAPHPPVAPQPPPPPQMANVNQPPPPPPPPVSQQQPMGMPPHFTSAPAPPYNNTPPSQPKMIPQSHMTPTMGQKMGHVPPGM